MTKDKTNQPAAVGAAAVQMGNGEYREQGRQAAEGSGQGAPAGDMAQARNEEQKRVNNPEELGEYIRQQERVRAEAHGDTEVRTQLRNQAMVAADALFASEDMLGPNGPRVSQGAREVNAATEMMMRQEEALQARSWVRNFFFGQDRDTAYAMQKEAEQNRVRIQEMNQIIADCEDCDSEVKTMLQQQLQTMLQEQNRLAGVAEEASGRTGLLGWLFN